MPFETTKFCYFCGTGPLEPIESGGWYCDTCKAEFMIIVHKKPRLTLEEAQTTFDNIPIPPKKGRRNIRYKANDAKKQEVGALP